MEQIERMNMGPNGLEVITTKGHCFTFSDENKPHPAFVNNGSPIPEVDAEANTLVFGSQQAAEKLLVMLANVTKH